MKKVLIGLLFAGVLFQGCSLFETEVTFHVGVVGEPVIYALSPDYQYESIVVTFDGSTISPGSYEDMDCVLGVSEDSITMTITWEKTDLSGNLQDTGTNDDYIDPEDGEYVCVYGFTAKQFSTLDEMNEYLSDRGLSTFSDGGSGGSSGACGSSYEGPDSDPQRDSYCQYAYAYLCLYGYASSSSEVQTYCDFYDAMNNGGPQCPYCQ